MKRLAVLACIAVLAVSCGSETADAPAPVAAESTALPAPTESTALPAPTVQSGLVSRDDVAITAPTVLWFWAPG
ncbi:MAG: hypothetical protein B7C54_07285 [Acidimicrobiales bacterium mtb01]|nr:hypothetical protein [Actinomycetota bacterium]TEX44937.1 MAG: hypothetical protein B7C54_07285 [Acidimicrobiales bacterium mtb01]